MLNIGRTNTIIYCHNWSATVRFYRDILAFSVQFENDWFMEFLVSGRSFVSLADAARATVGDSGGQGLTLSWQVADLDGARSYLIEKGVAVGPVQSRWGDKCFYFKDPEGVRIEIWSIH